MNKALKSTSICLVYGICMGFHLAFGAEDGASFAFDNSADINNESFDSPKSDGPMYHPKSTMFHEHSAQEPLDNQSFYSSNQSFADRPTARRITKDEYDQAARVLGLSPDRNWTEPRIIKQEMEQLKLLDQQPLGNSTEELAAHSDRIDQLSMAGEIMRTYIKQRSSEPVSSPQNDVPEFNPSTSFDRSDAVISTKKPAAEPTGLKDKALSAIKNAATWLNSTKVIGWLNDLGNGNRAVREAIRIAQGRRSDGFNREEKERFDAIFKKLTTKEKQKVANTWAKDRVATIQKLEDKLEKASLIRHNNAATESISREIIAAINHTREEMIALAQEIQQILPSHEMIIPLKKTNYDASKERIINSDYMVFEIVDLRSINPSQSIAQQYAQLTDRGFLGIKDPSVSYLNPDTLLRRYGRWVARNIQINPSQPIMEQLETQTQQLLGTPWSKIDGSIKTAIFIQLDDTIQQMAQYEAESKNTEYAIEYSKQLQSIVLAMTPRDIATLSTEEIQNLTPDTISRLSTPQLQSLTAAQIDALLSDQIQALDVNQIVDLTTQQLEAFRPDQIQQLRPDQIKALSIEKIIELNTLQIGALTKNQIAALTPAKVAALRVVQLRAMSQEQIQALSKEQLTALTGTKINALANRQIPFLSLRQIQDLSADQIAALNPIKTDALTTQQIATLSKNQIQALQPRQLEILMPRLPIDKLKQLTQSQIIHISSDARSIYRNTLEKP